jgi:hypothetical protein
MTEAQWLSATDPIPSLEFLKGKATPRKSKLFANACLRRIRHLIPLAPFHRLIDVAEFEADGLANNRQVGTVVRDTKGNFANDFPGGHVLAALRELRDWLEKRERRTWGHLKAQNIARSSADAVAYHALHASGYERGDTPAAETRVWIAAKAAEQTAQCELLRCVFANPFQPVSLEAAWLSHHGGIVAKISRAVYDERAFDRLAIVADALEEAGCTNADILSHCRNPGPHVRGCWVVDLLLRNE